MYAPMSLYTIFAPGIVSSGVANMSFARLSGSCVISSYALNAGKPGRVREQIANRHAILVRAGPRRGDSVCTGASRSTRPCATSCIIAVVRPIDLRERREVPQRVLVRRRTRRPVEVADGVLRDDAVARADDGDRARKRAVARGAVQDAASPNRESRPRRDWRVAVGKAIGFARRWRRVRRSAHVACETQATLAGERGGEHDTCRAAHGRIIPARQVAPGMMGGLRTDGASGRRLWVADWRRA